MGSVQEIVCVDWRDAPSETHDVFVDVDTGDEARECDEANNVVYLGEGFCGGIE
jgi:hypothetical protein